MCAKKLNAKQLRELQQQEKKKKIAETEKKNKEKAEAAAKAKILAEAKNKKYPTKKEGRKSLAKAAGLKSTFVLDEKVYMTSFGKGNSAILEKEISEGTHTELSPNPSFSLTDITQHKYEILSQRINGLVATSDNPAHHNNETKVPGDNLLLKDKLENRFYGKTFADDNIHIQIIYNILDIEKIFAVYSTNAVFAINNLFRIDADDKNDLLSNLTVQKTYNDFKSGIQSDFDNLYKNNRLGYFGTAFYVSKGNKQIKRNPDEIFSILTLIGQLRQWCVHEENDEEWKKYWLYNLDDEKCLPQNHQKILDTLYNNATHNINTDFVKTNKVNIQILATIYSSESFKQIITEYYEFLVLKKYKNTGFSIKKLREKMIEGTEILDDEYNSVRHKLYQLIDFVIFHLYKNEDAAIADEIVSKLRCAYNDEIKEKIYSDESSRLWNKLESVIKKDIIPSINGNNIKALNKNVIENISVETLDLPDISKASYFTKLIYLLTLFLSGKEINDLLTTLINKFDNIRSFNCIINELNLESEFTDDYKFFNNSQKILDELIFLNRFAKMSSVDVNAKHIMYRDAIDILGIQTSKTDEEIDKMIDNILCIGADGKPIKSKDKGLRNFIASNVITSRRFEYLVRYANSKKVRQVADNSVIVKFVLKELPEEQINRYYESCREPDKLPVTEVTEKIEYLAEQIKNMSFEKFENAGKYQSIKDYEKDKLEELEIKRRYQAIIRLYLTVMYLLIKNLVNINSRYVIAFHCLERDAQLYGIEYNKKKKNHNALTLSLMGIELDNGGNITKPLDISNAATAGCHYLRKKKWYDITYTNLKNSDKNVIITFRNNAAHLNAIKNIDKTSVDIKYINSYYELYHYMFQKYAEMNTKTPSNKTKEYFDSFNEYKSYNKDFVKAYCVPFAYNLPRFKNLTIDDLFDRNSDRNPQNKNKKDDK